MIFVNDPRLYTRGFLLTPDMASPLPGWESVSLPREGKALYFHHAPNAPAAFCQMQDLYLLLCGTAMDTRTGEMGLSVLARSLLASAAGEGADGPEGSRRPEAFAGSCPAASYLSVFPGAGAFLDAVDHLSGRHLILLGRADLPSLFLFQDATGMRAVYYSEERECCASHADLLASHLNCPEHPFFPEYERLFKNGENNSICFPGHQSRYRGILQLTPNHVLCLPNMAMTRFWPRAPLAPQTADEALEKALDIFNVQARALAACPKKLCLSATAGNDSRITLAVFRPFKDRITLYTYRDPQNALYGADTDMDAGYVRAFATEFSVPFKELVLEEAPAPDILALCQANAYQRHIPRAVTKECEAFPGDEYLHIRSNLLEIVRGRKTYREDHLPDSAPETFMRYRFRRAAGPWREEDVLPLYRRFWEDSDFEHLCGLKFTDILYWEERCGLWHGGSVLPESDLAFDTWCLYNCRDFLASQLAVPAEFQRTNYIVNAIVARAWPEIAFRLPNSRHTLAEEVSWFREGAPLPLPQPEWGNASGSSILPEDPSIPAFFRIESQHVWSFGFSSCQAAPEDYAALKIRTSMTDGKPYDICFSLLYVCDCPGQFELSLRDSGNHLLFKHTLDVLQNGRALQFPCTCCREADTLKLRLKRLPPQSGEALSPSSAIVTILEWHILPVPEEALSAVEKPDACPSRSVSSRAITTLTTDVKSLKERRNALIAEKKALNERRRQLLERVDELKHANRALEHSNHALEKERSVLSREKDALTQQNAQLSENFKSLQSRHDDLLTKSQAAAQQAAALEEELSSLRHSFSYRLSRLLTAPARYAASILSFRRKNN